jgi:hypothetical protein
MQITPVSNVKLLNMEMIMTGDYEHLNPDMGEAQSYLLAFKDPPPPSWYVEVVFFVIIN